MGFDFSGIATLVWGAAFWTVGLFGQLMRYFGFASTLLALIFMLQLVRKFFGHSIHSDLVRRTKSTNKGTGK